MASLQRRATLVEEQRLGGRLLRRSAAQAVGAHADDDGTDGAAEPEVEISAQALADNVVVEQMSRVVEVDPPHPPPPPCRRRRSAPRDLYVPSQPRVPPQIEGGLLVLPHCEAGEGGTSLAHDCANGTCGYVGMIRKTFN